MNILQVSTSDGGGGANKIASALQTGFGRRGHGSWMAVGRKVTDNPNVYRIPSGSTSASKRNAFRAADMALAPLDRRVPGIHRTRQALRTAHPAEYMRARWEGREFFGYPGSRTILDLPPVTPEIVHLHNLHGDYFDLPYLAELSRTVPTLLTLHDEWTMTGHCGYGITCERWRIGCGQCPDLTLYPSIRVDGTHENWLAKAAIYGQSRMYVSAPSRWLLDRAKESTLAAGAVDFRLIPNGVDEQLFRPGDQRLARSLLELPSQPLVLLFTANRLQRNKYKDVATVTAAAERVAGELTDRPLLLIALGGDGPTRQLQNGELRFVPYESEPQRVAAYYQAADVYLHAANADTFPTTVLEALSTGTPVVATAVGGIHEQLRSLAGWPGAWPGAGVDADAATGVLVAHGDAAGMAAATVALMSDDELRHQVGRNAAADAAIRFGLEGQLDATLTWYAEAGHDWRGWRSSPM